jgi:hypothetical protein
LHDVFLESISEVDRRVGSADAVDSSDPAVREQSWDYLITSPPFFV